MRFVDADGMVPEGGDNKTTTSGNSGYKVFFFDGPNRPADNGVKGSSYSASVFVVNPNGDVSGPFSGSTYPNSVSNSNNSPAASTVNEGTVSFSNAFGHHGGTEKGLNLGTNDVSKESERVVSGTSATGGKTNVADANVHSGFSDNYNGPQI